MVKKHCEMSVTVVGSALAIIILITYLEAKGLLDNTGPVTRKNRNGTMNLQNSLILFLLINVAYLLILIVLCFIFIK